MHWAGRKFKIDMDDFEMFSLSEQSNSQFSVLAFQFYFPKRVKKVSDPMYDGGYLSFTSLCKKPIIVRNTLQQLKKIQGE